MKVKKSIAIVMCCILSASSTFVFNAYAESDNKNLTILSIVNDSDELSKIEKYLEHFKGKNVKLTPDRSFRKSSSDSRINLFEEEEARKNKMSPLMDMDSIESVFTTNQPNAVPTLSMFNVNEAKKVYIYNETLLEKIQNGDSLEDEDFLWQIPIVNTLDENGVIYLAESKMDGEIITKAIEFPSDNRKMFLSNEEMISLINDYNEENVNIKNVYFADLPISIMGTVVAVVELDTNEILFITIQDVNYYNGMGYKQVYSFDEMMQYLNSFSEKFS